MTIKASYLTTEYRKDIEKHMNEKYGHVIEEIDKAIKDSILSFQNKATIQLSLCSSSCEQIVEYYKMFEYEADYRYLDPENWYSDECEITISWEGVANE